MRQLVRSTMTAETLGAMAAPTDPLAAHAATAEVRRLAGNSGSTSASEDGTRRAPPKPCTTRPPMNMAATGATAHANEPNRKITTPVVNTLRRPSRSARRPPITMNDASTML
jgi:hypothetical protein